MDSETGISHEARQTKRGGGRAYRSRVEPFVDFIRAQRQQRKTWQEIAERLHSEKGCVITFQGLHQFYRRYLKRQSRPHWEAQPVSQPARPNGPARRPDQSKPLLAATPPGRPFRRPNPDNLKLNDPTDV